ncbi:MAG TPA: sigma-70 family RNA polymerase sigma factor, partial [Polyangiales bacterium]
MIEAGPIGHYPSVIATPTADPAPRTPAEQARLARMIEQDYQPIWRLLRRLGLNAEQAEDAAQQVFLIVAERLSDIREGSERAFAYGSALRVAQGMRRRGAREALWGEEPLAASPGPAPDELSDQRRALRRVDQALSAMPLELRSVFVLFELSGFTSPEIAEIAGLPLGTVASRLRRARESFRALIAAGADGRRDDLQGEG